MQRAREQRGLSLDELTRTTKIGKATLIALESTDVLHLPAAIYTRGFVKSYAREVGLDPDRTAEEYLRHLRPAPAEEVFAGKEHVRAVPVHAHHDRAVAHDDMREFFVLNHTRRFSRLTMMAAVVGLVFYVVSFNRQAANEELRSDLRNPDDHVAIQAEGIKDADHAEAARHTVDAVSMTISGPLTVELLPQGPCWLVATVDGQRVIARLMQPGERQTLAVTEEALLRVGDPGALSISINGRSGRVLGPPGQPVDVKITKDNFRDFLSS